MSKLLKFNRILINNSVKRYAGTHDPTKLKQYEKFWTFVCIGGAPILVGAMAYVVINYKHPKRIPYKPYEYMYKIQRPFPWGDGNHSFFHNPKLNAVPGVGYEEEEESH
ncbi:Cytochrome c oxidase polypeptide VIa-liver [Intoshia linei]|uniref:Cytochrome c oxidase polypeptide VIa-liver n=1 Tax=Intoshia linei TaxID=1819745 RepID=A0A177B689_9BILA|nr:Cytochrome c oxidase polypeptide VIa-liver [Intoshia linei]